MQTRKRAVSLQFRAVGGQPLPQRQRQQPHQAVQVVNQIEFLVADAFDGHQRRREDLHAFNQQAQLQQAAQDGFLLGDFVVENLRPPVAVAHQLVAAAACATRCCCAGASASSDVNSDCDW